MTTTTQTKHATATAATERHWFFQLVSAVARLVRHRREAAQLLELDDRKLADIGLSRSDVLIALNSSPLHDPTSELARLAGRRPY